jgi:hypothetical protein
VLVREHGAVALGFDIKSMIDDDTKPPPAPGTITDSPPQHPASLLEGQSNSIEGQSPRYGEDVGFHAFYEGSSDCQFAAQTTSKASKAPCPPLAVIAHKYRRNHHVLTNIVAEGAGDRAGLQTNDCIIQVDGFDVTTVTNTVVMHKIGEAAGRSQNSAHPDSQGGGVRLQVRRVLPSAAIGHAPAVLGSARKKAVVWEQPDPETASVLAHAPPAGRESGVVQQAGPGDF